MRTRLIGCMAAVLTAFVMAPVTAQEHVCEATETVAGCERRLVEAAKAAASSQDAEAAEADGTENEELQKKTTGPNVSESLAQSAIRDFLPRFAGSLLSSDPTEDLRALDLRFNTPVGGTAGPRVTFQGGVTIHKAELYEPLVDAVPESIREATRKRLADELEDGDDATAFVSVNLESRTIGRAFAYHQQDVDALATAIVADATSVVKEPANVVDLQSSFNQTLSKISSIDPNRHDDPACVLTTAAGVIPLPQASQLPVGCLTAEVREQLDALYTPLTRYEATRQFEIARVLTDAGFNRISELVNNQPQFNVTAEYRSRLAVVGPNEWVARARFEVGFANMNTLRRHCLALAAAKPGGGGAGGAEALDLNCLRSYTQLPATRRRLARSDRAWLAGEVRFRPDYEIGLEEDSVAFSLGSGLGFGVSGGYGRYLGSADADEADRDRLDLHVSYDFADDDDLRQSRFLAGLFYTLRLSGNASGVVGLAWANKPEFVDGADRQLHANLGLSYKFNRGKDDDK